jgi:ADP-heptose:LPS heptosyltransferase
VKIAVGFRNGIGNFIMLTPCLQALVAYAQEPVDLILDEEWDRQAPIVHIAERCFFINEVKHFKFYSKDDYEISHMSFHNAIDNVFSKFNEDFEIPFNRMRHWVEEERLHEVEYYIEEVKSRFKIPLSFPPQYMPTDDWSNSKKKYILISNGYLKTPGKTWDHKSYPHWEELVSMICELYNEYDVIAVGGEDDIIWANELTNKCPIDSYCGKLTITESANLIKNSSCIITTDSACMHIADALRVKGVALFGSTLVSKNGPYNGTILPITSPIECSPCQSLPHAVQCEDPTSCMKAIDPSIVFSALRNLIG